MTVPLPSDPALHALVTLVAAPAPGPAGTDVYGCRAERKLVVTPAAAAALRGVVAAHLAVEQYVPGRTRTRIHSIYFDSEDFALYRRSLAPGPTPSLKLRLRAYGDAATPDRPDAGRFLEAKLGVTTPDGPRRKRKARLALSDRKVAKVMKARAGTKPVSRRKFWRPLLEYLAAFGVRPRLTVTYVREAFVDATGQVRITFDEDYRASVVDGAASPLGGPIGRLDDQVIVEIKLVQDPPGWLLCALGQLGLPAEGMAFSKFKTAVPLLFPAMATPMEAPAR